VHFQKTVVPNADLRGSDFAQGVSISGHERMSTFRKIVCKTISSDFRNATEIVHVPRSSLKVDANTVLIKNHVLGINASDINFTNGKYLPGVQPPFDVGFEALGQVEEVGENVRDIKQGDAVIYSGFESTYA
jgi:NADPH:quinone reductase-like Zn-dependent oxidoreductase